MAKKAAAKPAARPMTKSQLYAAISDKTGLSKKETTAVFDALGEEINKSLGRRGVGVIQIPGLIKIYKHKTPARAARKGPKPGDPSTIIEYKAKPARTVVKVKALKNLKDMV